MDQSVDLSNLDDLLMVVGESLTKLKEQVETGKVCGYRVAAFDMCHLAGEFTNCRPFRIVPRTALHGSVVLVKKPYTGYVSITELEQVDIERLAELGIPEE